MISLNQQTAIWFLQLNQTQRQHFFSELCEQDRIRLAFLACDIYKQVLKETRDSKSLKIVFGVCKNGSIADFTSHTALDL